MQTSGTPTSQLAVTVADAPHLARLFDDPGPFATIYLATESEIDNAAHRSELRWKDLRRELADRGALDKTLEAIDPLVADAHLQGQTLAVVVGSDGVLLVEHHPEPPTRDLGVVAPLPRVGPLVEWRQSSPGYVVVLADRTGADLVAVTATGREIDAQAGGADHPISKVGAGGWSQRRYQQRAENVWEQNAKDVAATIAQLVNRVDARIVLIAGDVRALELIRSEADPNVAPLLREVDGYRGAGIDDDETAAAITRMVAGAVAEDTVALLRKFREEEGQHDRAANGVAATVTALQMAQVETLLLHDDPHDERTLWYGPTAAHVAVDRQTLADLGVEAPQEGRLVDVLIRAAFGTGAGVRIVPSASAVNEGAGAILRFATP